MIKLLLISICVLTATVDAAQGKPSFKEKELCISVKDQRMATLKIQQLRFELFALIHFQNALVARTFREKNIYLSRIYAARTMKAEVERVLTAYKNEEITYAHALKLLDETRRRINRETNNVASETHQGRTPSFSILPRISKHPKRKKIN